MVRRAVGVVSAPLTRADLDRFEALVREMPPIVLSSAEFAHIETNSVGVMRFLLAAREGWPATIAALREAVGLLRGVEWSGCDYDCCCVTRCQPKCAALMGTPEKERQHAPDCALAAFLRRFA